MTIYEDRFFKNSDSGNIFNSTTKEIFGTGDSGDLIISTNTALPANYLIPDLTSIDTTGRYFNGGFHLGIYRNLTIDSSATLTTDTGRGLILLVRGTLTLNGTIDCAGMGSATDVAAISSVPNNLIGVALAGVGGFGPSGSGTTPNATVVSAGGGGGGYALSSGTGVKGGRGQAMQYSFLPFFQRSPVAAYLNYILCGGGGGEGGEGLSGHGGFSGGLVYIFANKIVTGATSVITVSGSIGANPGDGGGGGGFVALAYGEFIDGGLSIFANGADGTQGNGVDGGVGGAGGVNTTINGSPVSGSDGTDGAGPTYPCSGGGGGGASGVILARQLI